jgi:dihydrofolate reductase
MRPMIYYVATTVDHYIAHEDESVHGFLAEGHHIPDYLNSLSDFDTVLMGRSTYEWGFQYGAQPGQPSPTYPHMMHYIFSRTLPDYQHPQVKVIREDAATVVRDIKQQDGKPIYLCGGGNFAGFLLENELIDELILKVNPVIFGEGIPLFGNSRKMVSLSLLDAKIYNNGVAFMHYQIAYL